MFMFCYVYVLLCLCFVMYELGKHFSGVAGKGIKNRLYANILENYVSVFVMCMFDS